MPSLEVAVELPPPLRSPDHQRPLSEHEGLTAQLQGLHQLHIQLETAIAFLEGREPHGVPLFDGEFQELFSNFQFSNPVATTAAGSDSPMAPQSTAEAQRHYTELMSQISEIQKDFGKLMQQQQGRKGDNVSDTDDSSGSGSSCDESFQEEEQGEESSLDDIQGRGTYASDSPSSFYSQNEDSFSVTSVEEDSYEKKQRNNDSDSCGLKLLHYRNSENDEGENGSENGINGNSTSIVYAAITTKSLTKVQVAPPDELNESQNNDAQTRDGDGSPSSATLRLQLLQSKRQLESRGREIARLQGLVQSLEAKVVSAAAPKAVMAQAVEIQKKCADMEIQLRNAELDASEAKAQVSALQKAARERDKEIANMKNPSELAMDQWQQGKKLQKRIDLLQSKLQEKSKETEAAKKAQKMLQGQVNRLNNELSQSQATTKNVLAKLVKQELKNSNGQFGGKNVTGTVVKRMMEDMEALQQRYDALERQLALQAGGKQQQQQSSFFNSGGSNAACVYSSFSAPVSPAINKNASNYSLSRYTESNGCAAQNATTERCSGNDNGSSSSNAGSVARDLKILDLELERDQALARAARLQERLNFVLEELGQTTIDNTGHTSKLSPYQQQDRRRNSTIATKKGSSTTHSSEREKELLDTITLLKSALEKTRKGLENGVSSARYMQAVEKAKHAAERVKELEAALKEASMHHERVTVAQKESADAQVMISALRGQLRDAKRRGREDAAARNEIINAQIAELERALRERDALLAALKHSACDEARALVAEGLTPKMVVHELLSARAGLAAALEREEALKQELAPFDAVFFAELHQLKREHEELRMMCASYESRSK